MAELSPVMLVNLDAVVPRGRQDVGERLIAVRIIDPLDLIESRKRVSHVLRVDQWLLTLSEERVGRLRQRSPLGSRQQTMLVVGLPSHLQDILRSGVPEDTRM
jgi:hypothetical protein